MKAAASIINPHLLYQQAFSTMTIIKALKFDLPLMIGKFQFVAASLHKMIYKWHVAGCYFVSCRMV